MKSFQWFIIAIAVGAYLAGPLVDPDLWWHVTVGRWMIAHQAIPAAEQWNLLALGTPWRAYSWIAEILFASIEHLAGLKGLYVLKLFLAAALAAASMAVFGKISRDWFYGGLLGVFVATATFNHFTLRPQLFVWIYFVAVVYVADCIALEKRLSVKRGAQLTALMALWANTHLTAVLGLLAVGGWLWTRGRERLTVFALMCAFAGTLLTPYLGGEWLTFFSKTGHPFRHDAISEFQPATILQYSTGFLVLLAVVLGVFLFRRPRSVAPARLLAMMLFVVGGLAVVKFLPFAYLYLGAVAAQLWREHGKGDELGNVAEGFRRLEGLYHKLSGPGFSFFILCIIAVNVHGPWRQPLNLKVVPTEPVDFIIERDLPTPLLNEFGHGGYLMYRFSNEAGELAEEHKVIIDGRTNVNPPEVWEKYIAAIRGRHDWHDFVELADPKTILWRTESPFSTLLMQAPEWCWIYESGEKWKGYSVFLRRDEYEARRETLSASDCDAESA